MRKNLDFLKNDSGSLAVMTAILLPIIISTVGVAVDMGQAYLVKERLQAALDASALAAASSSVDSQAELEERFNDFFTANYGDSPLGNVANTHITIQGDDVVATATASVDTKFLKWIGVSDIDVDSRSNVKREVRGIEVAMVLDITGSMAGSKIEALKEATELFITTMFDRVSNPDYLKIGMVPYVATVNVGAEIVDDYVDTPLVPARPSVGFNMSSNTAYQGCIVERPYPHDTLDSDVATGGYWKAFWWEHTTGDNKDNFWDSTKGGSLNMPYTQCNERRNPNLGCPVDNPIVPLTNDENTLINSARALKYWCRGGTLGNVGMAWGWRVLSPQEPFTQGANYDDFMWRKAVIMMTDGDNVLFRKSGIKAASDYSAYGRISDNVLGTKNLNTAITVVNNRLLETCAAMKAKGITIYTITFGGTPNAATKALYEKCASDKNKYKHAPSDQELIDIYFQIGKELSNLHIQE